MRCPFCQSEDTRVIDSRESEEGETVRRRRACQACEERYTTYERVELHLPQVIKTDGKRERFNEDKLREGFAIALQKRPINAQQIENVIHRLLRRFAFSGNEEISSVDIGEAVMAELRVLDEVAYVRFASVYRKFQDLDEFNELVQRLRDVLPEDQNADEMATQKPAPEKTTPEHVTPEQTANLSLIAGAKRKNKPN